LLPGLMHPFAEKGIAGPLLGVLVARKRLD
jgi:hypothetical protein